MDVCVSNHGYTTIALSPLYLEYTFAAFAYVFETIAMFVIPIAIKIIEFTPSCVHGAKYLLEFVLRVLELMLLPLGLRAA